MLTDLKWCSIYLLFVSILKYYYHILVKLELSTLCKPSKQTAMTKYNYKS